MRRRTVWTSGLDVLDLVCRCGYTGAAHRPSAVTPFGRGLCRDIRSSCDRFEPVEIPEQDWPEPVYPAPDGPAVYMLVVHQQVSGWAYQYTMPVPAPLKPVSERTFRTIGHVAGDWFYADFAGGPNHRVLYAPDPGGITINRCGCGVNQTMHYHTFGPSDGFEVVAEMAPLLEWVRANTFREDWCELVPIPIGEPAAPATAAGAAPITPALSVPIGTAIGDAVVMAVPISVLNAVRSVVDYSWDSEERDYNEQPAEGRDKHVFRDLTALDDWLIDNEFEWSVT